MPQPKSAMSMQVSLSMHQSHNPSLLYVLHPCFYTVILNLSCAHTQTPPYKNPMQLYTSTNTNTRSSYQLRLVNLDHSTSTTQPRLINLDSSTYYHQMPPPNPYRPRVSPSLSQSSSEFVSIMTNIPAIISINPDSPKSGG